MDYCDGAGRTAGSNSGLPRSYRISSMPPSCPLPSICLTVRRLAHPRYPDGVHGDGDVLEGRSGNEVRAQGRSRRRGVPDRRQPPAMNRGTEGRAAVQGSMDSTDLGPSVRGEHRRRYRATDAVSSTGTFPATARERRRCRTRTVGPAWRSRRSVALRYVEAARRGAGRFRCTAQNTVQGFRGRYQAARG